jgi:hypothetical protein
VTDIVERLRREAEFIALQKELGYAHRESAYLFEAAADEIERLRAELKEERSHLATQYEIRGVKEEGQ